MGYMESPRLSNWNQTDYQLTPLCDSQWNKEYLLILWNGTPKTLSPLLSFSKDRILL